MITGFVRSDLYTNIYVLTASHRNTPQHEEKCPKLFLVYLAPVQREILPRFWKTGRNSESKSSISKV